MAKGFWRSMPGELVRWVALSDRCTHHDRQRAPEKALSVEAFDPTSLL